jgi:hypothetical protein
MEEEEGVESDKILVYGNMSEETYSEQQKLLYLVGKYEE